MARATFANIRLKNFMVPGVEGGVTVHLPSGERMDVFDAAERYKKDGVPLVVIAGKEYGTVRPGLGGQGAAAPGRAGRHRGKLRADPPEQPGGDGRASAAIQTRPERRVARPPARNG
jgi:aconitate hydratase